MIVWKDKLSYDGKGITYDEIGNLTTYRGYTLDWSNVIGHNITYIYDASGLRLSKTIGGETTTFEYVDGLLMYEKKGDTEVHYAYDGDGNPRYIQTVALDGTVEEGYIVTSTRGDVIAIVDTAGNIVVNYTYDAWGNILSVTDQNGEKITSTDHIGNLNSLRYRSYYYDADTGLCYLQSRYYDPEVRRFINADDVGILEEDQSNILEHNVFIYCLNNPVNMKDSEGEAAMVIGMVVAYTLTDYIINAGITIIVVQQVYKGHKKGKKYYKCIVKKTKTKKKSVNLPSVKKIKLDMEHIMSGHSPGGKRGGDNKDRFPVYMSEKNIKNAILNAYKSAKIIRTQGTRVFLEGKWGKYKIQMWLNKAKNIIESAWPKY